jgi:hypothetical protein
MLTSASAANGTSAETKSDTIAHVARANLK